METHIIFYIVAIIGVISHFVIDLQKARNLGIVFDLKKNLSLTGIYFFFAMVLVFFKPELSPVLNILGEKTSESLLTWWAVGFCADALFKALIGMGLAKIKPISEPVPPAEPTKV